MDGELGFVQAIEVWVPEGERLRLDGGAYGPHGAFATLSRETVFRRGEGLPGEVWASGRPQIWDDLGVRFIRAGAAAAAGFDAAVGIPVFRSDDLVAVVVLLCGSRASTGGCIETWQVDSELQELFLVDAYYGQLAAFAEMSRRMRFQRGRGLPGITWQARSPKIIDDARSSTSFLRSSLAREHGIGLGLGIPIFQASFITHVLLLLSAQKTPLARAFEVWVRDAEGDLVIREAAYADGLDAFGQRRRAMSVKPGEGPPGQALSSGRPVILDVKRDGPSEEGFEVGVAIPIHNGSRVTAVVMLLC